MHWIWVLGAVALAWFVYHGERGRRKGKDPLGVWDYYRSGAWVVAAFNDWMAKGGAFPPSATVSMSHYPELQPFVDSWRDIRAEVEEIVERRKAGRINEDMFFGEIAPDSWKRFYIKWHSDVLPEAWEWCPLTSRLVADNDLVEIAMFSIMEDGSRVPPHMGPYRGALRFHLGLSCPSNPELCYLTLDGVRIPWRDGETLLFDDTYTHSVVNESGETRIILFLDVSRKFRSPWAERVHRFVRTRIAPLTTRTNQLPVTDD